MQHGLRIAPSPSEHGKQLSAQEFLGMLKDTAVLGAKHPTWRASAKALHCQRTNHNQTSAVLFATVPRSGNTWTRQLLEEASGIATVTQYDATPQEVACGLTLDCEHVREALPGETFLFKTHLPFVPSPVPLDPLPTRALMTIRNPLDNYLAYIRYVETNKVTTRNTPYYTFEEFAEKWLSHINFWFQKAKMSCLDLMMVRFEDLAAAAEEVLPVTTEFVFGPGKADVAHALRAYPPSDKLMAEHLFDGDVSRVTEKVAAVIAEVGAPAPEHELTWAKLQKWANFSLAEHGEALKLFGYHEFAKQAAEAAASEFERQ